MTQFLNYHRRSLAIVVSLGLHAAIIAALLLPSSGALSALDLRAAGDQSQPGINVELVPSPTTGPRLASPKPITQALNSFTSMTEPSVSDDWKASAAQPAGSLTDVFGKDLFAQTPQQAQTTKPKTTAQHVKTDNRNSLSANDLWKAIAPCWKRVADKKTLGVTLSVSFSPLGNLAKPPIILREPGVPLDEQRLKSESLAISALANCGPYLMAFGQSDVSVQFPAGG